MLKTMRNNFKSYSWTLWLVILAFVGGFIFFSGMGGNDAMPEHTVLSVGNREVSDADFQKYLVRALDGYSRQFKGSFNRSLITQLQIPERALQDLVNANIIQMECDRLNLTIGDKELADSITGDPRFQRDGRFIGTAEYESLLSYNQIRVKDFEDDLRQSLLSDKLRELVAAGVIVNWSALKEEYRQENDKANLEYLSFKTDEIKDEIVPTAAEMQAYYQSHPNAYRSEETRSGCAVVVKLNDFRSQLKIAETELFKYFQSNTSQYRIPGKTKVSRIYLKYTPETREAVLQKANQLAQTLNRDNFAQTARELSQDDKAKDGGDWGYTAWRDFTAQEQTMLDKMAENAVSTSPVDAGGAFSLLMVSEKVADRQETYDEVKGRIRTMMEDQKLRELANARMAQIYDQVKEAKDLKTAAADRKLAVVAVGPVTNGQAVPKVDDMGYISRRLFDFQPGQVTPPSELPDGMFVAQLQAVTPPQPLPFDRVQDKVRTAVIQERKLDLLQARAQAVVRQLNGLTDAKKIEDFLKKENLKSETAEYRRGDRLAGFFKKGLDDSVFAMVPGAFSEPVRFDSTVIAIKLKDKKVTSDADFNANRQQAYEKKLNQDREAAFSAYIMQRRPAYKTRFNNELFEKVKEYAISRYR